MAEKKSDEFLKKTKSAFAGFGSRTGKVFQNVKEQAAPAAGKLAQQVKTTSKKAVEDIGGKLRDVKAAAEQKTSEKLTVARLPDSEFSILFPQGYERQRPKLSLKAPIKSAEAAPVTYHKSTSISDNTVQISRVPQEGALPSGDPQSVIDELHRTITESQGIVEVKNGADCGGHPYIYSIVKELPPEQIGGVTYHLRLQVSSGSDVIEVLGEFKEINTTGTRETMCMELARRAGVADVFRDWSADPYDPTFTKGLLKNLSEKEGLDGLFPEHPLTQSREFLLAALENRFTKLKEDTPGGEEPAPDGSGEGSQSGEDAGEFLAGLFVDECRRHTYPVEMDREKKSADSPAPDSPAPAAKEETAPPKAPEPPSVKPVSTRNAIKVIYYLMAADGEIFHSEEEKFDAIGSELDPNFTENKDQIIAECKSQMEKVIDPEDYYDVLQDGVELALASSVRTADTFITPKLLVWDLLTIAFSDESYDEAERRLLKYVVRKLDIDKAVFLEMESSILTLMDLEKELSWIKTTDRPYMTVESMVNEIADRKNVIFESVKTLIAL